MDEQNHIVSGIYTSRAEAEAVRDGLLERGLSPGQVNIVENATTVRLNERANR